MNRRNTELKQVGALIKGLLEDTHHVIIDSSSLLGSTFGMDEVKAPTRLEEIMPTAIPTNSADLKRILHTIRLRIIYDTGMELDRLRLPLRNMEIVFDELNLDQYTPVEGEESVKDRLEDPASGDILVAVLRKITDQAIAINKQRSFFCKALEDLHTSSQRSREYMDQEVNKALQDPRIQEIDQASLEETIQLFLVDALKGRGLRDVHLRTAVFRRIRGFLLPIMAQAAFDIFDRLKECTEYARLKI